MNVQLMHRLLYALKRQWGTSSSYIQILLSEADTRTGSRVIKRQVLSMPAVLLPQSQARKFIQDIGYLAANKNFTYGALNDFNTISLIVDKADMPPHFDPELNGFIIHDNKRFERVSFTNLFDTIYILLARGVEGSYTFAQQDESTFNRLYLQEIVNYELN